jgi:acetyl-CoA carboxylase biotin carboxyl carrier protein
MPAKKPAPAKSTKVQSPELALITNLADILNSTGLSEIELEQKGVRVRVSKGFAAATHVTHAMPAAAPVAAPSAMAAPVAAAPAAKTGAESAGAVKSPMVGTVYLASAPGTPNFVTVGAPVKEGQTVLIIEAMKTMNQIPAPRSGTVTAILVENGQPVEFGEAMLVIE